VPAQRVRDTPIWRPVGFETAPKTETAIRACNKDLARQLSVQSDQIDAAATPKIPPRPGNDFSGIARSDVVLRKSAGTSLGRRSVRVGVARWIVGGN